MNHELSDQIAGDMAWEYWTPIKGWNKHKAFVDRVLGPLPEKPKIPLSTRLQEQLKKHIKRTGK